MKYLLPAVITALVALTAAVSHAKAPLAPAKKIKATMLPNPCEQDFDLKVVLSPTQGAGSWPIGFSLAFKHDVKRGIASRLQTDQNSDFSEADCQRWQKNNWSLLDRILYDSKRVERAKLVCLNVASITYHLGAKAEHADVCLGNINDDAVASAFKTFLNGGDGMVR